MSITRVYSGQAGGLTREHLGWTMSLLDVEGVPYEGTLSYLSFDATRDDAEHVAIALGNSDDPLDDWIFYLSSTHPITGQVTDG